MTAFEAFVALLGSATRTPGAKLSALL